MSNVRPTQGEQRKPSNHTVRMERRSHAEITGVMDVSSFHENEIILKVDTGLMVITGDSLHVEKLLLDDGKLDVDGHIDSILYESPRKQQMKLSHWFGFKK